MARTGSSMGNGSGDYALAFSTAPGARRTPATRDVVTAIDGEPVKNAFTLRFALGRRRAGDQVKLTVQRGEETLEIEVTLGERPVAQASRERLPVPMPGEPERGRGGGNR